MLGTHTADGGVPKVENVVATSSMDAMYVARSGMAATEEIAFATYVLWAFSSVSLTALIAALMATKLTSSILSMVAVTCKHQSCSGDCATACGLTECVTHQRCKTCRKRPRLHGRIAVKRLTRVLVATTVGCNATAALFMAS